MSSRGRRHSFSASSSLAKRPAENGGKLIPIPPHQAKKRVALGNITNHTNPSHRHALRTTPTSGNQATGISIVKSKKTSSSSILNTDWPRNYVVASSATKSSTLNSTRDALLPRSDRPAPCITPILAPCSMDISSSRSDDGSVSMDESMSTCDSLKSPDIEYLDTIDASELASIERKATNMLHISDQPDIISGDICKRGTFMKMEENDAIINVDNNLLDPQLCAAIACDIYKHLRASENKKRPSTDFMEGVQKDINASMRAILIDWLVEVAEEYRLVPDTLFLTVNYIDRYLSGNVMNRQRLQLLGVACMMIASIQALGIMYVREGASSTLLQQLRQQSPAIREKYSQHKYKFVAKKYCPPSIPSEFFQDHNK
ncbi:hypothetical protein Syun_008253 [Stephania yunnanensis]|uniref:Cyclin-like domain-containing protein n=1 Tax=Stephania yunnanensis TaxID=152371 RepID=A0AAP0KE66_9MAGN